jgi:hypothetical protein
VTGFRRQKEPGRAVRSAQLLRVFSGKCFEEILSPSPLRTPSCSIRAFFMVFCSLQSGQPMSLLNGDVFFVKYQDAGVASIVERGVVAVAFLVLV